MHRRIKKWAARITAGVLSGLLLLAGTAIPGIAAGDLADKEIVKTDTSWKYYDYDAGKGQNFDPNTTSAVSGDTRHGWTYPSDVTNGYDDSYWKTGVGPFGFKRNDGDYLPITTKLVANVDGTASTSSSQTTIPTYFFRQAFTLTAAEAADFQSLLYNVEYDDAVILYLNGTVIGEHNVPAGGYSSNLEYGSAGTVGNSATNTGNVDVSTLLRTGENVLAIELHQDASNSSDVYLQVASVSLSTKLASVRAITVAPGSDESELNFNWYSRSDEESIVNLYKDGVLVKAYSGGTPAATGDSAGFYTNKVTATDLEADTTYTYTLQNGSTVTPAQEIRTGNADGFTFLLAGDPQIGTGGYLNGITGWQDTMGKALNQMGQIDFMISAGDQVDNAKDEEQYDGYFSPEEMQNMPVAQSMGNHDVPSRYGGNQNYADHYNLPNSSTLGASDNQNGGDYWFTYGDTLFMMLNSNNRSTTEHELFMRQAMSKNPDAKWNVVVFHHSIYSVASHWNDTDINERRADLVPVFDELGIDIVLMGHDHSYTRTHQLENNQVLDNQEVDENGAVVDPTGILYVTANSASGSKYYDIKITPEWAASQSQLSVPTLTKITMDANSFTMDTYRMDTMTVTDSHSIVKTSDDGNPPVSTVTRAMLTELVEEAEAYNLEGHDAVLATNFETALTTAKGVLANENADDDEIADAYYDLKDALDLLKAETLDGSDKNGTDGGGNKPNTGDTALRVLLPLALLGAGAAAVTVYKKRLFTK